MARKADTPKPPSIADTDFDFIAKRLAEIRAEEGRTAPKPEHATEASVDLAAFY